MKGLAPRGTKKLQRGLPLWEEQWVEHDVRVKSGGLGAVPVALVLLVMFRVLGDEE